MSRELIFVYNADSGLFNGLADAAHKIFSPDTYSCQLCKVTYGWFTERGTWRDFIEQLDATCRFLHRDEFRAAYPDVAVELPAILVVESNTPQICVPAEALNACQTVEALMTRVREHCGSG
jgi:hypothetical protein